MALVVLFVIVALLLLGPRRNGRMPGPLAMALGVLFLLWMLAAFGLSQVWSAIFGHASQP